MLQSILAEVDSCRERLNKLRLFTEQQLSGINESLFVDYTYQSNRIEGNTLTLQETAIVIEKGMTIAGKNLREHLEAINHHEAVKFIHELASGVEEMNERNLKDIHALVLRGIDSQNAGHYRRINVLITGSRHVPPDALHLNAEMNSYFEFYQSQRFTLHPVLLAAEMHQRLVSIHPFVDGNGRTARLIMNLILISQGYTLVNIAGDSTSRLAYYNALEKCQCDNDCSVFQSMIANYELQSITQYLHLAGGGETSSTDSALVKSIPAP